MGRKARKTRWRTLPINPNGEVSDSEDSTTTTAQQLDGANANHEKQQILRPKSLNYNKLKFSSHKTRYYQANDKTFMDTRNAPPPPPSSTTTTTTAPTTTTTTIRSENNKITFNEDEYTKITTPRQDVLFKKGYLSKPKTYQTQTSTGNSTISTGNSTTGNGTPDHQSADGTESNDLDYESQQFVFPNGFVDQNGIYYINSYEPYPPHLVVYNAPICYSTDYPLSRSSKRYSTDSLTESIQSPQNEEATQSSGEAVNNIEYGTFYNLIYPPGYYYNSNGTAIPTDEAVLGSEVRKLKKRRRRKLTTANNKQESDGASASTTSNTCSSSDNEEEDDGGDDDDDDDDFQSDDDNSNNKSIELKPDAKEFIPRTTFHQHHHHHHHQQQFTHFIPTNFIPVPIELPPNFNPNVAAGGFLSTQPPPPPLPPQVINLNELQEEPQTKENFIPNCVPNTPPSPHEELNETKDVDEKMTNGIDIAKIVSKLEVAVKEQNKLPITTKQMSKTHNSKKLMVKTSNEIRRRSMDYEVKKTIEKESQTLPNTPKKLLSDVVVKKTITTTTPPLPPPPTPPSIMKCSTKYSTVNNKKLIKPQIPPSNVQSQRQQQQQQQQKNATTTTTTTANQWISVSRKKRNRNKQIENDVEVVEMETKQSDDGFEAYDVNQLKDVVPESTTSPSPSPIVTVNNEDDKVVDEQPLIVKTEAEEEEIIINVKVDDDDDDEVKKKKTENAQYTNNNNNNNCDEFDQLIQSLTELENKSQLLLKKQQKKSTKPKRVLITDIDQSGEQQIINNKPDKVKMVSTSKMLPSIKPIPSKKPVTVTINETKPSTPSPASTTSNNNNNNKKKKKQQIIKSDEIANVNLDKSYNFLLDTSTLHEEEKTNVEVSEELDKIIQRGMYSSLEEKIKSFNINDHFFKSLLPNLPSTTTTNNNSNSNSKMENDLTTALKNTTNIFAKRLIPNYRNDEDATTTTTSRGSFLDIANVQKDPGIVDSCYPITNAVREWMTKTRETSPDIELLKSPTTILKELNPKNVLYSQVRNLGVNSNEIEENWSLTPETSFDDDDDLLECWDDDLQIERKDNLVDEEKKKTLPMHGNLPYRAICCTLM